MATQSYCSHHFLLWSLSPPVVDQSSCCPLVLLWSITPPLVTWSCCGHLVTLQSLGDAAFTQFFLWALSFLFSLSPAVVTRSNYSFFCYAVVKGFYRGHSALLWSCWAKLILHDIFVLLGSFSPAVVTWTCWCD